MNSEFDIEVKVQLTTPEISKVDLSFNTVSLLASKPFYQVLHHEFPVSNELLLGLPDDAWHHILTHGKLDAASILSFALCCHTTYRVVKENSVAQQKLFNTNNMTQEPFLQAYQTRALNATQLKISQLTARFAHLPPPTLTVQPEEEEIKQPGPQGFTFKRSRV